MKRTTAPAGPTSKRQRKDTPLWDWRAIPIQARQRIIEELVHDLQTQIDALASEYYNLLDFKDTEQLTQRYHRLIVLKAQLFKSVYDMLTLEDQPRFFAPLEVQDVTGSVIN